MAKYIYGGDTETVHGEPNSLQFYSEDVACDDIFFVDSKTARRTFLKWCDKRARNVQHVIYVHNLQFDLPEFLWGKHANLISTAGDYDFTDGRWRITGVYGTPTFCKLSDGHGTTILIIDSYSFFHESLASAAARVCPDLPKLRRISGIGERRFTAKDAGFVEYAMRDAVIAYHLGRAVEQIVTEFDIQQPLSSADMSARIFKRQFLNYTIPQPSRDVIDCALLSYHGGKNNVTVQAGWYENVNSIDISSAYPAAMHGLPAFSNDKLYRRYASKRGVRVKTVPEHGVYFVSGDVRACEWPSVFSHSFKALTGRIDRVAMQGYELNEAMRSAELQPTSIKGWYYDADKDLQAPALRGFVEHFYRLKETTTHSTLRYLYKLIMNSLYGKFIQTRKRGTSSFTDIDAGVTVTASELVAGGMFHPFIASDITAQTRVTIHQIEHSTKALHTATDGVFTQAKKLPKLKGGLGGLTLEAKDGTLLLVRNKCYVLYTAKGPKTKPSLVFNGKHIRKFALHGFQGSVTDLERLIATNKRKYTVNKPNRLRESLKRGLTPNDFVKREMTLKVGPITLRSSAARARTRS